MSWPSHRSVEEIRRVITGLFNVGVDLVGQIGYLPTAPDVVQVGYALGRQFWGRGLAGEALQLLVDHLHRDPALYRAVA